jgi:serpin B
MAAASSPFVLALVRMVFSQKIKSGVTFVAMLLCALLGSSTFARCDLAKPAGSPDPTFTARLNDFGFRLLGTLAGANGKNVMISPYSVSIALAMTYNGAVGDTKAAMAKTLAVSGMSDDQLNQDCEQMIEFVEKADPSVQIESADGAWAQSGFSINPAFLKVAHQFFDATVESVDFSTNPEGSADAINAWVSRSTHCKIPTIVKSLDRHTRLILTDAIYFRGRWQNPFNKSATKPRPFHLEGPRTGEIQVPMMVQSGKYQYLETDTFQGIALP